MKLKIIILTFTLISVNLNIQSQDNDLHYRILRDAQRVDCRKEIHLPNIMGYQTLKCDFHIHTIFSDGRVTPQERIDEAWREGLDVVAITDHNTPQQSYIKADYNTSYNLAKNNAAKRGLVLIKAMEYTSSKPVGHLNFLFIDDANQYADKSISAKQAVELAAGKGAFIIYNHPGWPDMNSDLFDFQLDFLKQKKIHAMEVINSQEFYPIVVDYCNQYKLAPLSTTDIHEPIQAIYNTDNQHRNFTLVFARDKSAESVKEAMFAGRTVAYGDNKLIGKEEFLLEIMKQSLVVSNLKMDESQYSCDIANTSDITYLLDGPAHQQITFPANRTIQLSGDLKNTNTIFQVTNTYISAQKHLELPLYSILADKNEVDIPYLKQNLNFIEAGTKLEFFCTTKDAEIRYTLDETEPTVTSALYTEPFSLNNSAILSLRAFHSGLKPSRVYKQQALLNILHSAQKVNAPKNGVNYRYYEGVFTSVTEIESKVKMLDQGITTSPDITKAKAEDHFGMIFTGYLYAPVDGLYTFSLESDDGSMLKVSGINLIDNDGSHSLKKEKASIRLKKGYHPYELLYFEDYEGQDLDLKWIIPGANKLEKISQKHLFIN